MVFLCEVCALSTETYILFTKVFIFFEHQCYPLQNSSLVELHTNGDIVSTFDSSVGSVQLVGSSACLLQSKKKTSVLIFLTEQNGQDFFSHVITGDESWIL